MKQIDWTNLESDYRRLGSDQAVADYYGCCINTARNYRIKQNIPTIKPPVNIAAEDIDKPAKLVAEMYGCSKTAVYSARQRKVKPPAKVRERTATSIKFAWVMAKLQEHWKRGSELDLRGLHSWFGVGESVQMKASVEELSKPNASARRHK